jgi:hypothetical protein
MQTKTGLLWTEGPEVLPVFGPKFILKSGKNCLEYDENIGAFWEIYEQAGVLMEPPITILSPDGRYTAYLQSEEVRMSHWIECLWIVESATGRVILSLKESLWSASQFEWRSDSQQATFWLRRYPGDAPNLFVQIELAALRARVASPQGKAAVVGHSSLLLWLEDWYARATR